MAEVISSGKNTDDRKGSEKIVGGRKGQSDFQKARMSAAAKARKQILDNHKEEFETLLNQFMREAGYTQKVIEKITWEKIEV